MGSFFQADFKIENIWNGQIVTQKDGNFIVDNCKWNQDIEPEQTRSFGFTASYETSFQNPGNYQMMNFVTRLKDEQYTVSYKENSDWGTGFTGEITIKNVGDTTIEDWELIFSFDRNITAYWCAKQLKKEGNRYHLQNDGHNANIKSGESLTIGIMGNGGKKGDGISKAVMRHISYEEFLSADSDEDGLTNLAELEIGSDYENEDTDGDGLPDAYEYCELETSPILKDTDGNGVSDAQEDFDGDKLNNLEEFENGTDPWEADSDEDGLSDYEEVKKYHTDPVKEDTDEDTLLDGEEVLIGFNPLKKDSNDNGILDPDEKVEQTLTENVTGGDEKVKQVSVSLETIGSIKDKVEIDNIYGLDVLSSEVEGLVGVPVEITSKVEFSEAKIRFYYDKAKLGNTQEDDLGVLWYDEENQWYELQENVEVDKENGVVTLTTPHFSKYMLVDRKIWYETWSKELDYRGKNAYFDFAYAVDTSKSMAAENRLATAKKALTSFVDEQTSKDKGALISFGGSATVISSLGTTKAQLKKAVSNLAITDKNGTDIENGLKKSISQLKKGKNANKVILLLSDGQAKYEEDVVKSANDSNIHIYTINVESEDAGANLKKYAEATGGEYYYCPTTAQIETVFAKIQNVSLDKIDKTDSDKDGVYDIFETNGVRLPNGKLIKSDCKKADTDGDGLSDGEEYGFNYEIESGKMKYQNRTIQLGKKKKVRYFLLHSDPTRKDSDNDTISDKYDPYPWHGYCGAAHPEKATFHKYEQQDSGYCKCKKCGYQIKSPEMEDKDILTVGDKQKMYCLSAMVTYYALARDRRYGNKYENMSRNEKLLLNKMRKIRRKDRYKNMYSYSDFSGDCVGKKYAVRGAVYITHSKVDLVNLPIYDGMYATLIGKGLAWFCPEFGLMWTAITLGTEWSNYDSLEKARASGEETVKLGLEYLEKHAKARSYKILCKGLLKGIETIEIARNFYDDTVRLDDDVYDICVQRGVKNPKIESEIKQSKALFVMRKLQEPLWCEMGGEFGHDDYLS